MNPITRNQDLKLIFSRFGEIKSCNIVCDHKTGISLGYAFIEFKEKDDAEMAYLKMSGVVIDDRRIYVDFSQSVSKVPKSFIKERERESDSRNRDYGVQGLVKKTRYRDHDEGKRDDYVFEDSRRYKKR